MSEHLAPTLYFVQVHLLCATLVALGAWALTSLRRASATAKFWVWTAASLNFAFPVGGFIDLFGAVEFTGARQIGPLAALDLRFAQHSLLAALLCAVWLSGTVLMLLRLALRILRERREPRRNELSVPDFRFQGVPVHITPGCFGPAVHGLVRTRVYLPFGLKGLLSKRELEAVLLHEVTHAKRRDNLLGLIHEVAQCALWFHPLLWLTGARLALYRELSCDETVLSASRGHSLVSALAKLAGPENSLVLRSAATSLVSSRLDRLLAPVMPGANRLLNGLLLAGFSTLLLSAVLLTVAHTACCLVPVA